MEENALDRLEKVTGELTLAISEARRLREEAKEQEKYKDKYLALQSWINSTTLTGIAAAQIVGCCPKSITNARKAGLLKGVSCGRTWRYPMKNVLEYKGFNAKH